ncbi:MAG: hypothetical protein RLZZ502_924 [Pseudomonadota bacterium]|jgi:nitroreductase
MIDQHALDTLFAHAHTLANFSVQPVSDDTLRAIYDTVKWAPTSMNCQPARYLFLRPGQGRAPLLDCLSPGNVDKTRVAPITVICAQDTRFYEHFPQIWQGEGTDKKFAANPAMAASTGNKSALLSMGYFILAARAHGLHCGPMGGFNAQKVNAAFFPDGRYQAELIINMGYGDPATASPRNARLPFETACQIL